MNAFAFIVGYVVVVALAGAGIQKVTMTGLLVRLVPAGRAKDTLPS